MSSVRLKRLQADYEKLQQYVKRHPRLQIVQAEGSPPERYQISYRVRSLRQTGTELQEARDHLVEIALPRNYPRTPPQCRMLTPIFHPNIAPHAVCIGDHWSAGEPLQSLVARIGEMIAYQSYNTKSPLNGEAARWVDQNLNKLPLDPVSMLVEERPKEHAPALASPVFADSAVQPPPVARPPTGVPASAKSDKAMVGPPRTDARVAGAEPDRIPFQCNACGGRFRVPAAARGKKVKCSRCGEVGIVTGP